MLTYAIVQGDRLHFDIVAQANEQQVFQAAISRGADNPSHELSANTLASEWPLDGERNLGGMTNCVAALAQFGNSANVALTEITECQVAEIRALQSVGLDELIGNVVAEAAPPRVSLQP